LEQQKAAIRAIGRTREVEAGADMAGFGALATFFGLGMFLDEAIMSLGISAIFAGGFVVIVGLVLIGGGVWLMYKGFTGH
jgi:hypothetical protein